MMNVEINKNVKLSEHFTLAEMTKTSVKTKDGNIPSRVHIENLKRLCGWLERLRQRCNQIRNEELGISSQRHTLTDGQRNYDYSAAEKEQPIIINSAYRSAAVNKAVGGAKGSNHLTGCAADIRVAGLEQALRYAVILLDIADEGREAFDELLLERSPRGTYWLHFAVRPPSQENRRKIRFIATRDCQGRS